MQKSKWTWAEFRSQVAVRLVTAVVIAAAAAIWTFLKVYGLLATSTLGVPAALAAALVIVFVVLGVVNQFQQMDRAAQQSRLERRTPHDIQRQIREWLWRSKFSIQDDPTPIADFRLKIDDDRKVPLTVAKATDAPWVTVTSNLALDAEHRAALDKRLGRVVEDIGLELIRLGMEWQPNVENGEVTGVVIGQLLPFTSSTTDLDLLRAIKNVRGSMVIAATIFNRAAVPALEAQSSKKKK